MNGGRMALYRKKLTDYKRVMVCWVCMVFLLFARSIGTHPEGRKGALLPSRGVAALPKGRSFWKGTRSLRGGRSPTPEGRGTRVLNAEPKGAAPAPKRWPIERANRRTCRENSHTAQETAFRSPNIGCSNYTTIVIVFPGAGSQYVEDSKGGLTLPEWPRHQS